MRSFKATLLSESTWNQFLKGISENPEPEALRIISQLLKIMLLVLDIFSPHVYAATQVWGGFPGQCVLILIPLTITVYWIFHTCQINDWMINHILYAIQQLLVPTNPWECTSRAEEQISIPKTRKTGPTPQGDIRLHIKTTARFQNMDPVWNHRTQIQLLSQCCPYSKWSEHRTFIKRLRKADNSLNHL